jgi:hypothetical protein
VSFLARQFLKLSRRWCYCCYCIRPRQCDLVTRLCDPQLVVVGRLCATCDHYRPCYWCTIAQLLYIIRWCINDLYLIVIICSTVSRYSSTSVSISSIIMISISSVVKVRWLLLCCCNALCGAAATAWNTTVVGVLALLTKHTFYTVARHCISRYYHVQATRNRHQLTTSHWYLSFLSTGIKLCLQTASHSPQQSAHYSRKPPAGS